MESYIFISREHTRLNALEGLQLFISFTTNFCFFQNCQLFILDPMNAMLMIIWVIQGILILNNWLQKILSLFLKFFPLRFWICRQVFRIFVTIGSNMDHEWLYGVLLHSKLHPQLSEFQFPFIFMISPTIITFRREVFEEVGWWFGAILTSSTTISNCCGLPQDTSYPLLSLLITTPCPL